MHFADKMEKSVREKGSPIVLALDFPFEKPENRHILYQRAERLLDAVHPYICAVKINHHLILPLGIFNGVSKLIEKAHEWNLPVIVDCKLNDIGSTNQVIAEYYYAAGFDALIANPFIGWDQGLAPVFEVAKRAQKGVILLVYMSHKGADEGYGQRVIDPETSTETFQYLLFAKKALKWGADGAVVGATRPEKIKEVYAAVTGKVPIYSPGVGVQGGSIEAALRAGASYLIVGRAITLSDEPAETAKKILDTAKKS
ncbi:orotidine 5'-phosphate decarboxylase [Candidatus Bathyarchaeota archaeon]|nr:orotidine 5'-phosphate decarboxylase [Candidatus Bathyarchaeota archaeon]